MTVNDFTSIVSDGLEGWNSQAVCESVDNAVSTANRRDFNDVVRATGSIEKVSNERSTGGLSDSSHKTSERRSGIASISIMYHAETICQMQNAFFSDKKCPHSYPVGISFILPIVM